MLYFVIFRLLIAKTPHGRFVPLNMNNLDSAQPVVSWPMPVGRGVYLHTCLARLRDSFEGVGHMHRHG